MRFCDVAPRLSLCKTVPKMLCVNHQTPCGTPLLADLIRQRHDEYTFLIHRCRATLTDVDYLTLRQLNKMHCLKNAVKIVHDLAKRESNHTPNPQDILAAFQNCSTSDIVVCQKKFLTSISHLSSPMIGFSVKHNYSQMSQTKKPESGIDSQGI